MRPITLQIAHKSPLLCEVLREALQHRQYLVRSYTTSGKQTLKQLNLHKPDLLILTNALSGLAGIEIAEQINHSQTQCLFMAANATESQAIKERVPALAAHVPLFVSMSELFYAIQEISSGRAYTSAQVEEWLHGPISTKAQQVDASFLKLLTPRELDIMRALAKSYTTPQIADKLFISNATVNNHRANIMQKLDLKGRNQLMSVAISLQPFYASAA